jgi:putative ribosome biogenesis GTPase RsgA
VLDAVRAGTIAGARHESYLALLEEIEERERNRY